MTRPRNMTAYNLHQGMYYKQPIKGSFVPEAPYGNPSNGNAPPIAQRDWREALAFPKMMLELATTGTPEERKAVREEFLAEDKDMSMFTRIYEAIPETEKPLYIEELAKTVIQMHKAMGIDFKIKDYTNAPPTFAEKVVELTNGSQITNQVQSQAAPLVPVTTSMPTVTSPQPTSTNHFERIKHTVIKHKDIFIIGALIYVMFQVSKSK